MKDYPKFFTQRYCVKHIIGLASPVPHKTSTESRKQKTKLSSLICLLLVNLWFSARPPWRPPYLEWSSPLTERPRSSSAAETVRRAGTSTSSQIECLKVKTFTLITFDNCDIKESHYLESSTWRTSRFVMLPLKAWRGKWNLNQNLKNVSWTAH